MCFIVYTGGIACKQCELAGKKRMFLDYHGMSRHFDRHNQKTINCDICGKPFLEMSLNQFNWHVWSHKSEEEQQEAVAAGTQPPKAPRKSKKPTEFPHLCQHCGKGFVSRAALEMHSNIHLPKEERDKTKQQCPECGKMYLPNSLTIHIKTTHRKILPPKRHKCTYKECNGRSFVTPSLLNQHIRAAHTKETPYHCEICGRGFFQKTGLKLHEAKHSEAKNYSCKLCFKAFKYDKNAKRHMLSNHKGEIDPESGILIA
jgi:hypothetical protein